MSPEREPQPNQLTLEAVSRMAVEVMLRDGYHVPTLIAEGSRKTTTGQINDMGRTHDERVRQMFVAGFALGQSGEMGILHQVFFVTEAWMSVADQGRLPDVSPSKDPKRKEILVVSNFKVQEQEMRGIVHEMIRNKGGELTELRQFQPGDSQPDLMFSPLLTGFAMGFTVGMGRP